MDQDYLGHRDARIRFDLKQHVSAVALIRANLRGTP